MDPGQAAAQEVGGRRDAPHPVGGAIPRVGRGPQPPALPLWRAPFITGNDAANTIPYGVPEYGDWTPEHGVRTFEAAMRVLAFIAHNAIRLFKRSGLPIIANTLGV